MARTQTAKQTSMLALAHRSTVLKVSIKNSGGSYVDMTDLYGHDWVVSAEINDSQDDYMITATVVLKRDIGFLSLSPLKTSNPLYGAVTGNRGIKIESAIVPPGQGPVAADWTVDFVGYIGAVAAGSRDRNQIELECYDEGYALQNNFIEEQIDYGSPSGVLVETEMQQILTDNSTGVTLYTPTSPGWYIHEYTQQKEPVLVAIRKLAEQMGYFLRYKWDNGTSAFRLTFYAPARASSTSNHTIPKTHYFDAVPNITYESIRNKIRVVYTDATTDERTTYETSDATSISAYGTRFMELCEDSASEIDSATEAQKFAEAALHDLKDPFMSIEIPMLYNPFIEPGDIITLEANRDFLDSATDFAVYSIRHTFANGSAKTVVVCS